MIDTDKYEGHTEGSWRAFVDIEGADTNTPYRTGAWTVGNAVSKSSAPPLHFDDEHDPHTYNVMGICLLHSINQNNEANAKLIADAPLLLAEVKRLREELDTIKSLRSFEHRFSPTGYGMAIEAWIGLTETGNGHWNDDKRSDFADLRLLTEEEWWQWQGEEIDWLWNHDEIKDALDYAHHTYLRKCIDMLNEEGGIMALKKRLQESDFE